MIAIPILLVIRMYIGSTKLLENGAPDVQYDLEGRLHGGHGGLNWGDSAKIKISMAAINNNNNEIKDSHAKHQSRDLHSIWCFRLFGDNSKVNTPIDIFRGITSEEKKVI